MTALSYVTDGDFEERVLKAERAVLVEFTAQWCGPCRQLGPVLKAIAEEETERLDVVAIDVDVSPGTAVKYGVLGTPTLMVFKGGEPVWSRVGARSKRKLLEELETELEPVS
ncbi:MULTISPECIES: thioredoxin family protein [unclassified Streptomyces]|uniref:thioredoxin family protein n=1 Tax=unclassified Streptomyces TaxID=2593676 RepID=UPI002E175162|nr:MULTISPECIES: thioredoxin domain-containing protein [unclassified Streptomyces]